MILSSGRSQDLIYFFCGFAANPKSINAMRDFFESNHNSVSALFSVWYFVAIDQLLKFGDPMR